MQFPLLLFLFAGLFLMGSLQNGAASQFSSDRIASGLDGGFRSDESLESYGSFVQRRGRIEETGDYYNYGPVPRDIEIIPAEIPFSTDPNILLAPKRAKVLGGCSTDKMTDKITCRMNILPQGMGGAGGLYQIVSADGSLLTACVIGHDFPGRAGVIRVDSNSAITTNHAGCVSGAAAQRLEQQLLSGSTLLTRRVEWPYDYPRDKEMLIENSFYIAQELYRWSISADLPALFSVR